MSLRMHEISLAFLLVVAAVAVGPVTVDGGETYWNEARRQLGMVGDRQQMVGRTTAAEDVLSVLRAVPLTQMSAGQRRNVKRRILAVLGLDHAPRPAAGWSGHRGRRAAAVAAYMMALYRGGGASDDNDDQAGSTSTPVPEDWTDSALLTSDWDHLNSADTIISFANQGFF